MEIDNFLPLEKTKFKINLIIYIFIIIIFRKIQKNITIQSKNPKISIFLPIYNKGEYLKRSINSIQIQTLKDIEIIAVNDYSTDNSLKILKKLSKKDSRIKIVNNDRNHGLLYSRAMGILNSTGEYLLDLDPDDKFEGNDNLEILYKNAIKYKTDVIIFLQKKIKIENIKNKKLRNLMIYNNTKKNKTRKHHNLITNKFTKRELLFKAFENFKNKIYGNKWNYHEDTIWSRIIIKYSNRTIFINKYIYIYILNEKSLMNNCRNSVEIKNKIYRFEMIKEIYKRVSILELNTILNLTNNNFNDIIKKDLEIKKKIIRIFIYFIKYYKYKKELIRIVENTLNKISNNKIILINNFNMNDKIQNNLIYSLIPKYFKEINRKIIISIDVNNEKLFNNTIEYIYNNDIFLGFNIYNIDSKIEKLIQMFPNNTFIFLNNKINNNKTLSLNISNLVNYKKLQIYNSSQISL